LAIKQARRQVVHGSLCVNRSFGFEFLPLKWDCRARKGLAFQAMALVFRRNRATTIDACQ
jgi:hypothetical protein